MKFFSFLYDRVMRWSKHPRALWYLAGMSFAEASFFPIPPDTLLAPMSLAEPQKAVRFATLTTIASVLGGIFGYVIGMFFIALIFRYILQFGYLDVFYQAKQWFDQWGFWALILAGFTPIPYKIFTIAAGTVSMPLLPFIIASIVGRGMRFYLVAGLMRWGGERMESLVRRYVDWIGWLVVVLSIIIGFVVIKK